MGSDFYGKITNDSNIPSENIQKYILATSGFAKGMLTDINHYEKKKTSKKNSMIKLMNSLMILQNLN